MSLEQYPLTVGPNMTQLEAMTLFGDDIDDSEFTTPAFSEAFEAKYGNPVPWPRAWKRLMAVTFDKSLAPKYTGKVLFVADNISFMDFCKASDFAAVTKGVRVLGRQELEGAWVQELVYKFDKIKPADLQELLGQFRVLSLEDAASLMKQRLREAVKKRFTSHGIEEYWASKARQYDVLDLDVALMLDNAEEPAEELAPPKYSDDEDNAMYVDKEPEPEVDLGVVLAFRTR
ncbi:hypothetical protein BDZ45DRAFT_683050 [Acephala macrosclerotiorum]|nr:hypothetical protein BDZ45DRAFT_683050 [Acephala macrosclerotiorum]